MADALTLSALPHTRSAVAALLERSKLAETAKEKATAALRTVQKKAASEAIQARAAHAATVVAAAAATGMIDGQFGDPSPDNCLGWCFTFRETPIPVMPLVALGLAAVGLGEHKAKGGVDYFGYVASAASGVAAGWTGATVRAELAKRRR